MLFVSHIPQTSAVYDSAYIHVRGFIPVIGGGGKGKGAGTGVRSRDGVCKTRKLAGHDWVGLLPRVNMDQVWCGSS
jgi:hypothetical protein